jgi:hypothetical protein
MEGRSEVLDVSLQVAHGPLAHEQRERIDAPSYDYRCRCPGCCFALNYPRRLIE